MTPLCLVRPWFMFIFVINFSKFILQSKIMQVGKYSKYKVFNLNLFHY